MAKKRVNYLQGAQKTEQGLKFKGVILEPIVENCEGCERVVEFEGEKYCASYPRPQAKWRNGACNFATHVKAEIDKAGKVKLNPLKASKRAARGR
ncbi:PxxKW family cysteine-rich protein [Desulfothermus okinawensis JCM 13304]